MVILKESFQEKKKKNHLSASQLHLRDTFFFKWKKKTSNVIKLSVHQNISSERKCIIELIKSSLICLPKVPPSVLVWTELSPNASIKWLTRCKQVAFSLLPLTVNLSQLIWEQQRKSELQLQCRLCDRALQRAAPDNLTQPCIYSCCNPKCSPALGGKPASPTRTPHAAWHR